MKRQSNPPKRRRSALALNSGGPNGRPARSNSGSQQVRTQIISKNASNKGCSGIKFPRKTRQISISISLWSGAQGLITIAFCPRKQPWSVAQVVVTTLLIEAQIRSYQQVFKENLAINLNPEKFLYLYLCMEHLVGAVQDVVLMQKQSNSDVIYFGHVRWVSSKMGHVGPKEGPFCGTVTF